MNITFCIDRVYLKPLCVTIKSILKTNSNKINFFIISSDFTNSDEKIVLTLLNNTDSTISFIKINDEIFSKLPTMEHISIATYYRLLLPELLPSNIKKTLYLDSDIIVTDDLSDFYNTDISKYSVSACPDSFYNDITFFNRLEYPETMGYFNAGVLLINLEYWRQNRISEKAISFITTYPEKCPFSDQDALNKTLNGTVLFNDFRYNYIINFFNTLYDFSKAKISFIYKNKMLNDSKNPCIIHFTGGIKPWLLDYRLPFKNTYLKLYYETFLQYPPKKFGRKGKEKLKFIIKDFLTKSKIKRYTETIQNSDYIESEQLINSRYNYN